MNKEEIKSIKNHVERHDAQALINLMDDLNSKNELKNARGDNTYRLYNSGNEIVLNFVEKYSKKFIRNKDIYVSAFLVALYEKDGFVKAHRDVVGDRETISTVLYLNDDYTGGELSFPEVDGGYTYITEKYELVYFPTPYLHRVNPVKSGKRYIITISYTDKLEYKNNLIRN